MLTYKKSHNREAGNFRGIHQRRRRNKLIFLINTTELENILISY